MSKINVIFKEKGKKEIFEVNSDSSFSELIQKYYQKFGVTKNNQTKSFLINGKDISPEDNQKLSELGLKDTSEIEVKETIESSQPQEEESKKEEPKPEEAPKGEAMHEESVINEEKKPEEEKPNGKAEKKVRKALSKLDMIKVKGVNRVTMEQNDSHILYVKDPEVYKSLVNPHSFIIFGEITTEDQEKQTQETIESLKKEGEQLKTVTEKKEVTKFEIIPEEEELSEEELDKEAIETVMNEAKCSRKEAIKALITHNGDPVEALLEIGC